MSKMVKLLSIIKKNFLILVHSKLSSLILIFGPIFLILIVGFGAGSNSLKNIETNVYVVENSNFSENFVALLRKNTFVVSKTYSLEDCVHGVKNLDKTVCIVLDKNDVVMPVNLSAEDMGSLEEAGFGYRVDMYVDFSKQRTAYSVMAVVEKLVGLFSSEIRGGAGMRLNQSLQEARSDISDNKVKIHNIRVVLGGLEGNIALTRGNLGSFDGSQLDSLISDLESSIFVLDSGIVYLDSNYPGSVGESGVSTSSLKQVLADLKSLKGEVNGLSSDDLDLLLAGYQEEIAGFVVDLKEIELALESVEEDIVLLSDMDFEHVLNPIPISYNSVSDDGSFQSSLDFIDYLFPTFLSFFVVLVSVIFSTIFVIKERTSNAYVRNASSPTSGLSFIFGTFFTVLVIVLFQCLCIFLIGSFFLNVSVWGMFPSLFLILFLGISVFTAIGLSVGYLFNSQETALIASISFVLFFIMFSPLINPLESAPLFIRDVLSFTPLILFENVLNKTLLYESSISYNVLSLSILAFTAVSLFVIANLVYLLTKGKEIK